jgi:hypothetical protein
MISETDNLRKVRRIGQDLIARHYKQLFQIGTLLKVNRVVLFYSPIV